MACHKPNPHTNFLNVYIQTANKMGFKKRILQSGKATVKLECKEQEESPTNRIINEHVHGFIATVINFLTS
jgi:hypothetical protein